MRRAVGFFIGTYSSTGPYIPDARGEGILSCNLDLDSGEIQKIQVYQENINATYLAKDEAGHLFAVCDNFDKTGEIKAFSINEDASLNLLSTRSTHGTSSCHVEYDSNKKKIFVSSYTNGLLSVHYFDGIRINSEPQLLNYEGNGPNLERQEASHIHQAVVSPEKEWLLTCDLGSDSIWLHDLSKEKLQIKTSISTPAGSGPRHLVCHPYLPFVYVFCELDANLLTYRMDRRTGLLEMISRSHTLPKDFTGEPAGAAIRLHPTAKALYVSNRNHHSLTVFTIEEDGVPKYHSNFSTKGKEPRDFNIDPLGQWLLSANQDSHNIVPFKLDSQTGLPAGTRGPDFPCGTPVSILF